MVLLGRCVVLAWVDGFFFVVLCFVLNVLDSVCLGVGAGGLLGLVMFLWWVDVCLGNFFI